MVAKDKPEAIQKARTLGYTVTEQDIQQDEDVLDTWFSSWLWPITVFDGIRNPDNVDIRTFYPTNDLVTAPEIIFFWVARMIMAGYAFRGEPPFRNVYFTGIVRDIQGRKMSKSLGNSPDPVQLMQQYGTDGVRVGMLLSSSAGNDLLFEERLCVQGRNFGHKIWNAHQLIQQWREDPELPPENHRIAIQWFEARYQQVLEEVNTHLERFRVSDALMAIYKLVWDDFCAWYLEMIKSQDKILDTRTYTATITFFQNLLKLLHPFMPFLSEELWQETSQNPLPMLQKERWPVQQGYDVALLEQSTKALELITSIRGWKHQHKIPLRQWTTLMVEKDLKPYIQKLAYVRRGESDDAMEAVQFGLHRCTFRLQLGKDVRQNETDRREELDRLRKFLASIEKKLGNSQFIQHAPKEVVARERKKREDVTAKIEQLQV